MTKISQLSDIGGSLAPDDEFVIRDVSDGSTPNKKVTASGFFNVANALGLTGLDNILAGAANEAKVQVFASGISGRTDTTLSGVVVARTTISGYFENASGVVSGVLFPVVTQTDIGTAPNQVPVCGMLGTMAFQDATFPSVDRIAVSSGIANASGTVIAVPTSDGYLRMPSGTGGIQFNGDTAAANALDDYEEGTWTPSVGGDATYTGQSGIYRKIGSLVFARFDITINVLGTGTQTIGAPFAGQGAGADSGSVAYYASLAASVISLRPYIGAGGTIYFANTSSAGTTSPNLPSTIFGNGSRVQGTIVYTV
jgi:hypothetical protein